MAKLDKFITYAYFKEECGLPETFDNEDLEHKIYRAQETLRMLMGDEFYQDYLTNYKNDTFSTAYTSLFPYIKQYIAWQAYEYWTQQANFKISNAGFRVHTENSSQPASDTQMAVIVKDAKYQGSYYKELLIGYLKSHNTDYSLYGYCCNDKSGNGFHISAVKNKHKQPQPYGTYGTDKHCCK